MGVPVVKKPSTPAQGGAGWEIKEKSPGAPANSSMRRLACDACRDRKVRCGREDPTCSRCVKVGNNCHYSSRSKPASTKMNLPRFLMTLNNRLKQAEAQLAVSPLMPNPQQFSMPWPEAGDLGSVTPATPAGASPLHMSVALPFARELHNNLSMLPDKIVSQQGMDDWSDKTGSEASDFQFSAFASTISTELLLAQSAGDPNQGFDMDPMFFDMPPCNTAQAVPATKPDILQGLYNRFFEVFHPIMPIINRTRFLSEITQPVQTIELQALSHAIAALGAFSTVEQRGLVEACYDQARNLLDICERQERGDSLQNINTLQTCVLLTLYEFKRPNFARAWMTLGRSIRLAKLMGLDRAGGRASAAAQWGVHTPVPIPTDPSDIEERRRTFWLLYIFDAFASVRTNSSPAFETPILVPVPSPSGYPDFEKTTDEMPNLQQIFELAEPIHLSSFSGTTVMIALYQRCFSHIQSSVQDSTSHAFWETHYRIDKAICHARTTLLSQHVSGHSEDPLSIALRMNLNSVEINLHEAAIMKAQNDDLPAALAAEALTKCILAATDMVEAVQLGRRLTDKRLEGFRQLDQFLIWPITSALQVCFRMLHNGDEDVSSYINSLRTLSTSMRELVDPEHIAPGLLEKADARVAEAERSTKKRRVPDE